MGQTRGTLLNPPSPSVLGSPGRVFPKRCFYLVKKSWEKDGETPCVTRVLRTRYSKKIESIRINLRDLVSVE